jgi:predicted phosphodiesterase
MIKLILYFILVIACLSLFLTASVIAQPVEQSVILVGDLGCNTEAEKTIAAIESENPSVVVFLGDLSYEAEASCFIDMVNELSKDATLLGIIGNHDSEEEESATLESTYLNYFESNNGWWGFESGNHFLIVGMNTQRDWKEGSDQYEFVKSRVDHSNAKFKIIVSHKLFLSPNSKHSAEAGMYSSYKSIIDNVNAVVQANNHCMAFKDKFIVSGAGGRSHYDCSGQGWWTNDSTFGFLKLVFGNNIAASFVSNDGKTIKTFEVS